MNSDNNFKEKYKDKNLMMATLIIVLTLVLMVVSYILIYKNIEKHMLYRLNEYCDTVIDEAFQKYERDSEILNAAANMLTLQDDYTKETFKTSLATCQPLFSTMKIRVLLPDNTIITSEGNTITSDSDYLDYNDILKMGEHTSDRILSKVSGDYIIRHYVPIKKDDKTLGILYGTTELKSLSSKLNISNYYENQLYIYVFNKANGDEILNTKLGNINPGNFYEKDYYGNDNLIKNINNYSSGHLQIGHGEKKSYLYYKDMNMNNWCVVVEVSYDYAMKSIKNIRNICLIFAISELFCLMIFYVKSLMNAKESLDKNILEEKASIAKRSEQAKTIFFNNLSHDIRTPLNAIHGFTDIALKETCDNSKIEDCLNKIFISNKYLLGLINDVLDANKICDTKIVLNLQNNNMSEILGEIITVFEAYINTKNIKFIYNFESIKNEEILCDRIKLYKIIVNILSNAVKYTDDNGEIEFIAFETENTYDLISYSFTIKDTGKGMSKETLDNIFKPYYVEDNTNNESHGLGMSIVKAIIDAMDGQLNIYSSKHKGTEYIIRLTFKKYFCNKNKNTLENIQKDFIAYDKTILVVEDNILNSQIIEDMIIRCGYKVLTARNYYECINILEAQKLDLIITDIKLPEIDGFDLVNKIRKIDGYYQNIPIIILSANSSDNNIKKAESMGIKHYLLKPVIYDELSLVLNSLL